MLENKSCIFCDGKEIYKNFICRSCYENLEFGVNFVGNLEYVDRVLVLAGYNQFIREKILNFKFRDQTYLYKVFADLLIEEMFRKKFDIGYKNITYIPLHPMDLLRRGYNQSHLLAREISNNTMLNLVNPIKKISRTSEQARLGSKKQRQKNISGAFEFVSNQNIEDLIIVDDIITTGTTIDEAARVAKQGGVKKVAALILATAHNF